MSVLTSAHLLGLLAELRAAGYHCESGDLSSFWGVVTTLGSLFFYVSSAIVAAAVAARAGKAVFASGRT